MKREVAEQLRSQLAVCNASLDEFVKIVRSSVPASEQQPLIEGIGAIFAIQTDKIDFAIKKFTEG